MRNVMVAVTDIRRALSALPETDEQFIWIQKNSIKKQGIRRDPSKWPENDIDGQKGYSSHLVSDRSQDL